MFVLCTFSLDFIHVGNGFSHLGKSPNGNSNTMLLNT